MYNCLYDCNYQSKRDSNLKQHMEKSHGWTYQRSKSNGKGLKNSASAESPMTPQMPTPSSQFFDAPTPEAQPNTPFLQPADNFGVPMALTDSTISAQSSREDDIAAFQQTFGNTWGTHNFDFNVDPLVELTPHRLSWDSTVEGTAMTEDNSMFGTNFDWANQDLTSMNVQLQTPVPSLMDAASNAYSPVSAVSPCQVNANIPKFSPNGQTNAMLYSPYSNNQDVHADEGYSGDFNQSMTNGAKVTGDFPLFAGPSDYMMSNHDSLFEELNMMGGPSTWS